MKFDINNYKGKYVMHCKTEEEAKEFCDYLRSIGKTWSNGSHYQHTFWIIDEERTCYDFNRGYRADVGFYSDNHYTILEWSDFTTEFTKADLKDGMVVELDNGDRCLVLGDRIIDNNGYLRLGDYSNDLKYRQWTINKVYKSTMFILRDIFNDAFLTLIWERKPKPEEMTLEEVCKALGKEIKIVKG